GRSCRHNRSPPFWQSYPRVGRLSLPALPDALAMSNFSVVVPLYNEEESVAILQRELTEALSGLDYEIIFVDDGSEDKTIAQIAPDPRIRVLRFEKNVGQSGAIFAGLRAIRS